MSGEFDFLSFFVTTVVDRSGHLLDLKQHVTSNITPLAVGISKISRRLEGPPLNDSEDMTTK
jgi:hypothetical protein